MRLEVKSKTEESVEQIAGQARRIPDQIQRLRYLREVVMLAPEAGRWRAWLRTTVAVVVRARLRR